MDAGAKAYCNYHSVVDCVVNEVEYNDCSEKIVRHGLSRLFIPVLSFANIIAAVVQDGSSALDATVSCLIGCDYSQLKIAAKFIVRAVMKIGVFAYVGIVGIFSPQKALDIMYNKFMVKPEYSRYPEEIDFSIPLKSHFNCVTARLMLPIRVAQIIISEFSLGLLKVIEFSFYRTDEGIFSKLVTPITGPLIVLTAFFNAHRLEALNIHTGYDYERL